MSLLIQRIASALTSMRVTKFLFALTLLSLQFSDVELNVIKSANCNCFEGQYYLMENFLPSVCTLLEHHIIYCIRRNKLEINLFVCQVTSGIKIGNLPTIEQHLKLVQNSSWITDFSGCSCVNLKLVYFVAWSNVETIEM